MAGAVRSDRPRAQEEDHRHSVFERELDLRAGPGAAGQDDRHIRAQDVDRVAAVHRLVAPAEMRVDGDLDPVVDGVRPVIAPGAVESLIVLDPGANDAEDEARPRLNVVERFAHLRHGPAAGSSQQVKTLSGKELADRLRERWIAGFSAPEDAGDLEASGVVLLVTGFVQGASARSCHRSRPRNRVPATGLCR